MTTMSEMKPTFEDGREAQFREMMQQLAQLQAKYKGVRGELLAKVHEEFLSLKPSGVKAPASAAPLSVARAPAPMPEPAPAKAKRDPAPAAPPAPAVLAPPPAAVATIAKGKAANLAPEKILPSCRLCGRGMKLEGSNLVCAKGHTRSA